MLFSIPEAEDLADLCIECPGSVLLWLCTCCQIRSAVVICVGGVLASEAGPSEASPVPADEPSPPGKCLTPTLIQTHLY